jgi:hypothetical protein
MILTFSFEEIVDGFDWAYAEMDEPATVPNIMTTQSTAPRREHRVTEEIVDRFIWSQEKSNGQVLS